MPASKICLDTIQRHIILRVKSLIYNLLQFRRPDIIRQYKKSGKLLDIGCGDGSISSLLSEFVIRGGDFVFGAKKNNILIGGVEK